MSKTCLFYAALSCMQRPTQLITIQELWACHPQKEGETPCPLLRSWSACVVSIFTILALFFVTLVSLNCSWIYFFQQLNKKKPEFHSIKYLKYLFILWNKWNCLLKTLHLQLCELLIFASLLLLHVQELCVSFGAGQASCCLVFTALLVLKIVGTKGVDNAVTTEMKNPKQ